MSPRFKPARSMLSALAFASSGAMMCSPAGAQLVQSNLELDGRTFALAPEELNRLSALGASVHTNDRGAQNRALAAARSVTNSTESRYVFALYESEIGRQRQD